MINLNLLKKANRQIKTINDATNINSSAKWHENT